MNTAPEPTPDEIRAELDAELDALRAKNAEREAENDQSWDAFWAEVQGEQRTEVIRGVIVNVPKDLPLSFDFLSPAIRGSSKVEDHKALLKDLFGVDVLDAWVAAGMGATELQVVLFWAMSHGKGRPITFREAYDQVQELEAGKAAAKTRGDASNGSGGRSKRTSAANTPSARKKSRS